MHGCLLYDDGRVGGEEGLVGVDTAVAIGRRLGVPVASVAAENAVRHFGFLSAFIGLDNPTSSRITRDLLGWTPTEAGLLADLDRDDSLVPESAAVPVE